MHKFPNKTGMLAGWHVSGCLGRSPGLLLLACHLAGLCLPLHTCAAGGIDGVGRSGQAR